MEKCFYWSFVQVKDGCSLTTYGTQDYPTWEEAYAACDKERAEMKKQGWYTHSPLIQEKK